MKDNFRHGNKIQWFEWAILLLSFGVILQVVRPIGKAHPQPGQPAAAGDRLAQSTMMKEHDQAMDPAAWRQLAEEALLVEMSIDKAGCILPRQLLADRNWREFGIPSDELAFFDFLQERLDTASLSTDERLASFLQAQQLYQSVGRLLRQEQGEEAFFAGMQQLYHIPVDHSRGHYLEVRPVTVGQWAIFVVRHQPPGGTAAAKDGPLE